MLWKRRIMMMSDAHIIVLVLPLTRKEKTMSFGID